MSALPDYSKKDKTELANLRANAERVLADPRRSKQHAAARKLLEALPPPATPLRGAGAVTATSEAVDQLTALARELEDEFDLSPPPATAQPHKFTGADGKPKVGGRQRRKAVAVDRYLSHRRGTAIAILGWIRQFDDNAETGGAWYIEHESAEAMPELLAAGGFEAAREAFVERLEEIGTPRR
jgi:hypothetical protein